MGTDIHMILQSRKKGIWRHKAAIDLDRNYDLFAVLAGVRANIPSNEDIVISPARGLPKDIGGEIDIKESGSIYIEIGNESSIPYLFFLGQHNFSWLTLREVLKHYIKHWKSQEVKEPLDYMLNKIKRYVKPKGMYRIVFGFDS